MQTTRRDPEAAAFRRIPIPVVFIYLLHFSILANAWDSGKLLHQCGTEKDRLKCVAHTHPVFHNDNCERWDCDPLLSSGLPFSCCMGETTRSEVLEVLNGSVIVWIGDSTARRANRQLYHWMEGTPFEDHRHMSHTKNIYNISSVTSVSLWTPVGTSISTKLLSLSSQLYPPEFEAKRKVFVFSFSTHDLLEHWQSGSEQALVSGPDTAQQRFARGCVRIVKQLKRRPGVNPKRDIILFRLPIAQACDSLPKNAHYANLCGTLGPGIDPINIFLERTQRLLVPLLSEAHPDVGLLDLLSWTWSDTRVDRAVCAPSDSAGTHFANDTARLAFVQQVLHAVRLLSVDRPGWEASSASIARSLCPVNHWHQPKKY